MQDLARLRATLEEIGRLLDAKDMEPDPARKDWAAQEREVSGLMMRIETEVLAEVVRSRPELDEAARVQLQTMGAFLGAEMSAVLHAAGRTNEAASMIRRALSIMPGDADLEAAKADMDGYTLLMRARWLRRNKKSSDRAFLRAAKEAQTEAIREAAKRGYAAPKPISSAPPLARINGCGVALYGHRDPWADGSHVATYCIALLFVPVFPLTAYRIIDHGNRRFSFLGQERLSPFARGYRKLLLAGAALFLAFTAVMGYLDSPQRKGRIAMEEAREHDAAGDRDGAIERYAQVAADQAWRSPELAEEAARAIVRLEAETVSKPFAPKDRAVAERLATRFRQLPEPVKSSAGEALGTQLAAWSGELDDPQAALQILELGDVSSTAKRQVAAKREELQVALGDRLAENWPVSALERYLEAGAREKAGAVVARLLAHPSLLAAHRGLIDRWLAAGRDERVENAVAAAVARSEAPERRALLEKGGMKALAALARRDPEDQEVAVAIAIIHRGRGHSQLGVDTLERLGTPGWLVPDAQMQLGALYLDLGDLVKSEAVLDPYLSARLPQFAGARQAYTAAVRSFRETMLQRAKSGALPAEINAKLDAAPPDDQPKIFFEYVGEQESQDERLLALRSAYEAYGDVVPASVTLGMVELRRANEVSGDERARLLARAEEVFLAIRAEAEDVPAYHLGLGQVYHRLGRAEEGDSELAALLEGHDPVIANQVANAYRELGLIKQAREIAQRAFDESSGPARNDAAQTLYLLSSSLEEQRSWLQKVTSNDPDVVASRAEVEAWLLYQSGKPEAADKVFAKAAAIYEQKAAHNSASANNAALAFQARYFCTGNEHFLEKAVSGLEAALRLEPDNSLVLGNLAAAYEYKGEVDVVGKWIDGSILHLQSNDSSELLSVLASGRLHDQVNAAVREDASLSKSLALSRQEEVLAPERTDAYERALDRATLLHDLQMLSELEQRLANLRRVDTTQIAERMAQFVRRDQDTRILASFEADLARLDGLLQRARKKKHAPTIAAIQVLQANVFDRRAVMTNALEDAQRAADCLDDAERTWDGFDLGWTRAAVMMRVAALAAMKTSPSLATALDENSRELGVALTLYDLSIRGDTGAIAAVKSQPALAEAVSRARLVPDPDLGLGAFILAKVAGDAELEHRASALFARPFDRTASAIAAKLTATKAANLTKALFDTSG